MLAGGDDDPYVLSFRGIDNEVYYMLDPNNKSHLLNYSGCGNTTNANHPAVQQMIMDSCRRHTSHSSLTRFAACLTSCPTACSASHEYNASAGLAQGLRMCWEGVLG